MIFPTFRIAISCLLLLSLAAFGIYHAGLHGNFFFDDIPSVVTAEGIRLEEFSTEALRAALSSGNAGVFGRPMAQLSFALNYYFGGLDPFVFKTTNLIIHIICTWLVFVLALHLFASTAPRKERHYELAAALTLAAAWLLHPIQLLPVLHVVQRMTSLSALFLLIALLLHIRGREDKRRSWLCLGWALFWPLSCLSKETGLLFPFFVLGWELIVFKAANNGLDPFARRFVAFAILILVAAAIYLLSPTGQWIVAGYRLRNFSLTERLLTEGRVIWFYLGLMIFPRLEALGLHHDDFSISYGLFSPWTTMASFLGIFGLILLAWRARTQTPLVSFGIVWFFIGHALESTFLPLELVHEHRNYIPLFGILLILSWYLFRYLDATGPKKTFCITLAVAMLITYALVTTLRSDQFGDEVRRTQVEAQHHRNSSRAQFEAGQALAALPGAASPASPARALARTHFELSTKLDSNSKAGLLGLINLSCLAEKHIDSSLVNRLALRLHDTPFAPGDRSILYAVKEISINGPNCLSRDEVDELFRAADTNPTISPSIRAILYSWYADYLWLNQKNLIDAKNALSKSILLVPSNPSNRLKWAQLTFLAGEYELTKQQLLALKNAPLSANERKTMERLLESSALEKPRINE